jgi:hypothetical protein
MLRNGIFSIHITRLFNASDDDVVEFLKSTEWPSDYFGLIPLNYCVWNELQKLI